MGLSGLNAFNIIASVHYVERESGLWIGTGGIPPLTVFTLHTYGLGVFLSGHNAAVG